MDQEVCLRYDVEGGLERLDQLVRQLLDESHRVGQEHGLAAGEVQTARGGVERREQPVLDEDPGVGQSVQQGGLAGVRVADDGDVAEGGTSTALALGVAMIGDVAQLGLELVDLAGQSPPVDLELGLTGASSGADAAGLLREAASTAPQPW